MIHEECKIFNSGNKTRITTIDFCSLYLYNNDNNNFRKQSVMIHLYYSVLADADDEKLVKIGNRLAAGVVGIMSGYE